MMAFNKRKAQLERWRESDTGRESSEIKNRPKRVKFADKCIFQAACAANDKIQVAKMVGDGYDINAVDEDGITALHQACIEDNFEMVEFLLKHGADVNISDNEGWTPLHAVATCCYVSIARLLLEHGANVVALNNDCSIPLDICKSDDIREIFIQDINAKGIDLKEARRGEEIMMAEDAKRWLVHGYNEEPHPITGATALHVAACKGYIKVMDQIIKAGVDINKKDFDGWTPLHAAAHWGQKEACELLLENSCDATIKDNCDQTALDTADPGVLSTFEHFKKKREAMKAVEREKEKEKEKERLQNSIPHTPATIAPPPVPVQKSHVPPARDEESETQRKVHAKRVRETRRSTQGVTLEELKSAVQFVKNTILGTTSSSDQTTTPSTVPAVPANVTVPRKEDETNVERRPSWRLRVDETDPSKFSLEDSRTLPPTPKHPSDSSVQRSSSLRSRAQSNKGEHASHARPPKPMCGTSETKDDEKEKDMKSSGAQGAILRKRKTKRRSTGIVQYNQDDIAQGTGGSDAEVGSGSGLSSDVEQGHESKSENGVTGTINYKKLYEEVLKENQHLKSRLSKAEEDVADLKIKLDRITLTPRITADDVDKREKKALERKLSEMEEELKESRHLRTENQKLRDENGALIRVISKLSK